jgi:hypothetical protein
MSDFDPNKGFGEIQPPIERQLYEDENHALRSMGRAALIIGLAGTYYNFLSTNGIRGAEGLIGLAYIGGAVLTFDKLGRNLPEEDDKNGLDKAIKAVGYSKYI